MKAVNVNDALKILYEYGAFVFATDSKRYSEMVDRIANLPELKSKTGKWTKEESIWGWDGRSYQCSVCGRSIHLDTKVEDLTDYPYCHCGAKMIFDRPDDFIMRGD